MRISRWIVRMLDRPPKPPPAEPASRTFRCATPYVQAGMDRLREKQARGEILTDGEIEWLRLDEPRRFYEGTSRTTARNIPNLWPKPATKKPEGPSNDI